MDAIKLVVESLQEVKTDGFHIVLTIVDGKVHGTLRTKTEMEVMAASIGEYKTEEE